MWHVYLKPVTSIIYMDFTYFTCAGTFFAHHKNIYVIHKNTLFIPTVGIYYLTPVYTLFSVRCRVNMSLFLASDLKSI